MNKATIEKKGLVANFQKQDMIDFQIIDVIVTCWGAVSSLSFFRAPCTTLLLAPWVRARATS